MTARIIDLEIYKGSKLKPTRFHAVAEQDRKVAIDISGVFSVTAARVYANAILQRCDAIEWEGRKR